WPTRNRDQPGLLQCIYAPRGRESGEIQLQPAIERQLEFGRTFATRQEPANRSNLEGLSWEPTGREPPAPRNPPVQRLTLRSGFRLREVQNGDHQLPTRLPGSKATRPTRPHGGRVGPSGWRSAIPWRHPVCPNSAHDV